MSVTPEAFKAAMRRLPSGIVVVTAVADGVTYALTASSFASVSLTPSLVSVNVAKSARMHAGLSGAQQFAVSVLAADQRELAIRFAVAGRDLATQFDGIDIVAAPVSGAPWIAGSTAWLDCSLWATYDGGENTIMVGEVHAAEVGERETAPLVHFDRTYL